MPRTPPIGVGRKYGAGAPGRSSAFRPSASDDFSWAIVRTVHRVVAYMGEKYCVHMYVYERCGRNAAPPMDND